MGINHEENEVLQEGKGGRREGFKIFEHWEILNFIINFGSLDKNEKFKN